MCVTPSYIWMEKGPGFEKIPVPCKQCWRCRANRVSDYVGRALCEAAISDSVCALTLTYAPRDDLADKVLTPRHFQDFIRKLRKSGHKIRYLVAGEYGELRGRAHFHAVLFFKGKAPEIPHKTKTYLEAWSEKIGTDEKGKPIMAPLGHVWADWTADDRALRYVCKYILKKEHGKGWFSISKKPTIGAEYFARRAREYARLGIMPRSFEYRAPGGQDRPYLLTGATRRDMLLAIVQAMGENIPDPKTRSEWVQKGMEKAEKWQHLRQLPLQETEQMIADMKEALDKGRMTDEQSELSVLRTHEFTKWHGEQIMKGLHNGTAFTQERKDRDEDDAEWR